MPSILTSSVTRAAFLVPGFRLGLTTDRSRFNMSGAILTRVTILAGSKEPEYPA